MARAIVLTLAAALLASACGRGDESITGSAALQEMLDEGVSTTAPPISAPTTTADDAAAEESTGSEPDGPPPDEPATDEPASDETASDETASDPSPPWAPTSLTDTSATAEPPLWTVDVLDVRAHDPDAWTQGFEVHDGILYESTGREGASTVRAVDIATGEVAHSVALADDFFAEGLTIADGRIVQLTWKNEVAFVRDLTTFEVVGEFAYEGEGWGVCDEGSRLVMSDGSATLTFRDPSTFEVVGRSEATLGGEPVSGINELECADGFVLANVWKTNAIIVVEPMAGEIVAVIDATALTLAAVGEAEPSVEVLNGIARVDDETFLLTGKYWPTMYLVRFVAA